MTRLAAVSEKWQPSHHSRRRERVPDARRSLRGNDSLTEDRIIPIYYGASRNRRHWRAPAPGVSIKLTAWSEGRRSPKMPADPRDGAADRDAV
jgi:hypothetical protein